MRQGGKVRLLGAPGAADYFLGATVRCAPPPGSNSRIDRLLIHHAAGRPAPPAWVVRAMRALEADAAQLWQASSCGGSSGADGAHALEP